MNLPALTDTLATWLHLVDGSIQFVRLVAPIPGVPRDELNQSHAGTYMPSRSWACGFHLGSGLVAIINEDGLFTQPSSAWSGPLPPGRRRVYRSTARSSSPAGPTTAPATTTRAGSPTLAWGDGVEWATPVLACPYCSSPNLTRDGHNQRGRAVQACRACGRHATSESTSLVAGHRFPRDIILLAVCYYLQLGTAAERIAGILADRGSDVSGRTILRWVHKFDPALSEGIRRYRKPPSARPGW